MAKTTESSYRGGELDLFASVTNWKAYDKAEISEYLIGNVLQSAPGSAGPTAALDHGGARQWLCLEAVPQRASSGVLA